MEVSDVEALRRQLLRLERRLTGTTVLCVLMIVGGLLLGPWTPQGATQPQVVRTSAVEILDRDGRIRATLDAVNRRPSLWLYGDDGRRRAGLVVGVGGAPEFVLADTQGRPRLSLRAGFDRAAEVRLADGSGHTRLGMWIGYDDEPGIWFLDELSRPGIGMKLLSGGVPRVWLYENATGRIIFTAP